jgi:hypothetical protein
MRFSGGSSFLPDIIDLSGHLGHHSIMPCLFPPGSCPVRYAMFDVQALEHHAEHHMFAQRLSSTDDSDGT